MSFMADFSAREQVLMFVGAVLFLVAFAALIQAGRLSRRLKFWRRVAHLAGVRKMDENELEDGEYELTGCPDDVVGNYQLWFGTFYVVKGAYFGYRRILLIPGSNDYTPTRFPVKDGKICGPSHEVLADFRRQHGGEATDKLIEDTVGKAVDGIPWPEQDKPSG